MVQNTLIARAGRGLLDLVALLLRGAGALCAAFGSLLITLFSLSGDHEADQLSEDQRIIRDSDTDGSRSHLYDHKLY
ncbi:hypothetical protein [Pseudohalioglobus lutimaris]|jgi:hypothetical protein|uniref:Uncharacterized protein n=1 Tax=Pseudohalioglobus lutimaris TaxID=1737061 RepID=A0A2N5WZT8_9GAMM|nr:hypothetical protein [Pseudohalioglobus lutimaris]PLW67765.1 hypothetical protein C0039_15200 [Pseudohalioglobus lutimaris]